MVPQPLSYRVPHSKKLLTKSVNYFTTIIELKYVFVREGKGNYGFREREPELSTDYTVLYDRRQTFP
jgi:hypothetical protein